MKLEPGKNGSQWTKEADAFMEAKFAEGWSSTMIAQTLGVTRSAVLGRAHRRHIKMPAKPIFVVKRPEAVPRPPVEKVKPIPVSVYASKIAACHDGACRYPTDTGFCMAPCERTYCDEHHALTHQGVWHAWKAA